MEIHPCLANNGYMSEKLKAALWVDAGLSRKIGVGLKIETYLGDLVRSSNHLDRMMLKVMLR